MFDNDKSKYATSWKEMSLDFKLMFVYHGFMMALLITSGLFSITFQIAIVIILICVIVALSGMHRIRNHWYWPGIGIKNLLGAIATLALGLFFLGAITPRVSPLHPGVFPWFAAGGGIILFNILSSLKIVFQSERQFLNYCGDRAASDSQVSEQAREPIWQKTLGAIFSLYFIAVWIAGVSFFWQFNIAFRDGALKPTLTQTETLVDHGQTVYITPEEKKVISLLEQTMFIGIPSALLFGAILHFVVGVKLFPNTPSLSEMGQRVNS